MAALRYPRTPGGDSIYAAPYNETWYFNIDSLCYHIAFHPNSRYTKDLTHYHFWAIATYASRQQMKAGYRKMKAAAIRYNCPALSQEADYRKVYTTVFASFSSKNNISSEEVDSALDKIQEYNNHLNLKEKTVALSALCDSYRISRLAERHNRSFNYVPLILELLQQVPLENSSDYHYLNYCIGNDYYRLGDSQQGLYYLQKALHNHPSHFSDRSDLRARTALAGYYAEKNMLDSADYYYRSLYDSPQQVRFRPVYDVVAASGIAQNLVRRGNFDQALPILQQWLPEARRFHVFSLQFYMYIAAGKCYLAQKQYPLAKNAIDSLRTLMQQFQTADLLLEVIPADNLPTEDFYELLFDYNSLTGNANHSTQYIDSMWIEYRRHQETNTPLIILRAEQNAFRAEKETFQHLFQANKTNKRALLALLALLLAVLLFLLYLYKRKQQAYIRLLQKGHEWAEKATLDSIATPEDLEIVRRAHQEMCNGRFKDCRLTLEQLAAELSVHRNTLSRAINRVTGKRFNRFINEYRIKEAIRRIENAPRDNKNLYIDSLYEELGFNSRTSFFRTFKQIVGLPPCAFYRKQSEELQGSQ
jgi:AraC-like DNA-binding protein